MIHPSAGTNTNLIQELRDGRILLRLLEIFSGTSMHIPPTASTQRIHCLTAMGRVLKFMQETWCIPLEQLSVDDLVQQQTSEKQMLTLLWKLILQTTGFQNSEDLLLEQRSRRKRNLLAVRTTSLKVQLTRWCQQQLATSTFASTTTVKDKDFWSPSTWQNGQLLFGLLRLVLPASDLPTEEELAASTSIQDQWPSLCDRAFALAETQLQVPPLLSGADLNNPRLEERSLLLYVAFLFRRIRETKELEWEQCVPHVESRLVEFRSQLESLGEKAAEITVKAELPPGNNKNLLKEVDENSVRKVEELASQIRSELDLRKRELHEYIGLCLHYGMQHPQRSKQDRVISEKLLKLASSTNDISGKFEKLLDSLASKEKLMRRVNDIKASSKLMVKEMYDLAAKVESSVKDESLFAECEVDVQAMEDVIARIISKNTSMQGLKPIEEGYQVFLDGRLDKIRKRMLQIKKEVFQKMGPAAMYDAEVDSIATWISKKEKLLKEKVRGVREQQ